MTLGTKLGGRPPSTEQVSINITEALISNASRRSTKHLALHRSDSPNPNRLQGYYDFSVVSRLTGGEHKYIQADRRQHHFVSFFKKMDSPVPTQKPSIAAQVVISIASKSKNGVIDFDSFPQPMRAFLPLLC